MKDSPLDVAAEVGAHQRAKRACERAEMLLGTALDFPENKDPADVIDFMAGELLEAIDRVLELEKERG